ncbi:SUVH2 [Acorus calamus]|uniref:SUVH2 n=1 Tax=Acorus calamus TaxID=4465 RepID=A0AAV9CLK7_ACOCL|nr:SUVH2 [Acorus calamus]
MDPTLQYPLNRNDDVVIRKSGNYYVPSYWDDFFISFDLLRRCSGDEDPSSETSAEASDRDDRPIRFSPTKIKNRDLQSTVQETLCLFLETCERLLDEYPNLGPGKRNRVDFNAAKILKNRWVNTGKAIVGDIFRYRIDLFMVGLHRRNMARINLKP